MYFCIALKSHDALAKKAGGLTAVGSLKDCQLLRYDKIGAASKAVVKMLYSHHTITISGFPKVFYCRQITKPLEGDDYG